MQIDWVAVGIIAGFAVFGLIMFLVFRSQSKKSEHPEAKFSNASQPTLLNHAPEGSQSEYSQSLLSFHKPSTPEPEAAKLKDEVPRFKRRLFFDDTEEYVGRRGSHAV